MNRRRLAIAGYAVFLVTYSFIKYGAAAPSAFSWPYARSTAILIFLTGVVPFLATLGGQPRFPWRGNPWMVAAVSVVLASILCMLGYAAYWGLFLANVPGVPGVVSVATRGIPWGVGMGLIATVYASETETE